MAPMIMMEPAKKLRNASPPYASPDVDQIDRVCYGEGIEAEFSYLPQGWKNPAFKERGFASRLED